MTHQPYEMSPIFQRAIEEVRSGRSERPGERSPTQRWAARLLNLLLIIAVVAVLLVGYGLVNNRWYRVVAIQGGSMSPALASGDAIVLTRAPAELTVGMIVTLEVDGQVVTHRVVSTAPDGTFTTKGDANSVADDWGNSEVHVIGVQRLRIPLVGKLLTSVASIHDSNAWLVDRSAVSGSADSSPCFSNCVIVESASETTEGEEHSNSTESQGQQLEDETPTDSPDD